MRKTLLVLIFLFSVVSAASSQRDIDEETRHYQTLEAISPEAASFFQEATEAMDAKDITRAEQGYREVIELAPDFVPALRRMSYVVADHQESLQLARRALSLEDHGYNLTAVVQALQRFEDSNSRREAYDLARQLIERLPDEPNALAIVAQVALRNNDRELLATAVEGLQNVDPNGIGTHYFIAVVALLNEEWEKAEAEVRRAQELGLPTEVAQRLLEGIEGRAKAWRYLRYASYGAVAWAMGLALLFGVGILLSRMTLRTIEADAQQSAGAHPGGGTNLMRRIYAAVLQVTSFYYYISIPIVLLLVLGAGGGVIYALLSLGHVPVKLLLVVIVLVFVTLVSVVRSLFIKVRDEDPGVRLAEGDAPKLFEVLREVAGKVGTPPVDSVFMVPGAEIAVFERGSPFAHLGKRTERCLILGLGAMQGMAELPFKAILSHEYGHLSNRDTAGGRVALHVRRSILASAEALASAGAAKWYNPAWLFLQAFYRLYLHVSHGASRLQEVLADRWAAFAYGAQAFADGLRHVIRRNIEFDFVTHREVHLSLQQSRPLTNLYALPIPTEFLPDEEHPDGAATPSEAIEQAFRAVMDAPGSPFDSHPPPNRRIAWVEKLEGTPDSVDSQMEVTKLLSDKDQLQELMTKQVTENVQAFLAYQEALAQQTAEGEDGDEITTVGSLTG